MSDQLRAAIVGAGFMGTVHARAIRWSDGVVATVVASSPEDGPAAAARVAADGFDESVEQVVRRDDIDVVHICVPNHLHARYTKLALEAGKHVVCEKPIAVDVAEAQEMIDGAQSAGVVATVPLVYRFYPTVREARDRVARGEAGAVHTIHGSYLQDWLADAGNSNWRVDSRLGGRSRAFADIGVHWCDLAEFVTGHRIIRLCAQTSLVHPQRQHGVAAADRTEDSAVVQFETDRGAIGSVVISQASPGRKNRLYLSVDAAEQSLAFNQEAPEHLAVGTREHSLLIARGTSTSPAVTPYDVLPVGHPQGYQDCFNAFVADTYRAVRGEQPDGLPTFADGMRAAVLTDAVLLSADAQSWVEVRE